VTPPLTSEQEMLRDTARRLLTSDLSRARVREAVDAGRPFPAEWWRRVAEVGWFSPLMLDGADGTPPVPTLALLASEAGRELAPVPLLGANIVIDAVSRCAPDRAGELVDALTSAASLAAWCVDERGLFFDGPGDLLLSGTPDGLSLSGTTVAEGRSDLDWLLVTANGPSGPAQHLVPAGAPGVSVRPARTIDPTREHVAVTFDDVALRPDWKLADVPGQVERQWALALLVQVAEVAGAMDAVFALNLSWLGQRRSFGRVLASYQELKHRVADMRVWLEAALACRDALAAALETGGRTDSPDGPTGGEEVALLASSAKSYVSHHGSELVQDCIQMHGGIGLTWEHDLHLYLRRITSVWGSLGTPADHHERITTLLEKG
jgi:alkylation response protein AidB-like acyl-CoA dehydrogenase